ncbi:hypothetical protein P8452_28373 [Trifolium repens]|nr:hypothetical protein P8452_28369 [Trifolium repens]WJX40952.1 hypothetical protein P8452_28373 [Trifolium repens]
MFCEAVIFGSKEVFFTIQTLRSIQTFTRSEFDNLRSNTLQFQIIGPTKKQPRNNATPEFHRFCQNRFQSKIKLFFSPMQKINTNI